MTLFWFFFIIFAIGFIIFSLIAKITIYFINRQSGVEVDCPSCGERNLLDYKIGYFAALIINLLVFFLYFSLNSATIKNFSSHPAVDPVAVKMLERLRENLQTRTELLKKYDEIFNISFKLLEKDKSYFKKISIREYRTGKAGETDIYRCEIQSDTTGGNAYSFLTNCVGNLSAKQPDFNQDTANITKIVRSIIKSKQTPLDFTVFYSIFWYLIGTVILMVFLCRIVYLIADLSSKEQKIKSKNIKLLTGIRNNLIFLDKECNNFKEKIDSVDYSINKIQNTSNSDQQFISEIKQALNKLQENLKRDSLSEYIKKTIEAIEDKDRYTIEIKDLSLMQRICQVIRKCY